MMVTHLHFHLATVALKASHSLAFKIAAQHSAELGCEALASAERRALADERRQARIQSRLGSQRARSLNQVQDQPASC